MYVMDRDIRVFEIVYTFIVVPHERVPFCILRDEKFCCKWDMSRRCVETVFLIQMRLSSRGSWSLWCWWSCFVASGTCFCPFPTRLLFCQQFRFWKRISANGLRDVNTRTCNTPNTCRKYEGPLQRFHSCKSDSFDTLSERVVWCRSTLQGRKGKTRRTNSYLGNGYHVNGGCLFTLLSWIRWSDWKIFEIGIFTSCTVPNHRQPVSFFWFFQKTAKKWKLVSLFVREGPNFLHNAWDDI